MRQSVSLGDAFDLNKITQNAIKVFTLRSIGFGIVFRPLCVEGCRNRVVDTALSGYPPHAIIVACIACLFGQALVLVPSIKGVAVAHGSGKSEVSGIGCFGGIHRVDLVAAICLETKDVVSNDFHAEIDVVFICVVVARRAYRITAAATSSIFSRCVIAVV